MENQTNTPEQAPVQRMAYKRRVRNILIHKPMQREFTFVMISLLMISTLAVGFVIHETIRDAAFGGGFQFGKINPYEILSEVSYQLILRVSAILFVTLLVLGVFGVFFLHRVAGPVYRFRQVFIRINEGKFPKFIRLREGDFFSETASEINRLVTKLRFDFEKLEKAKELAGEMMNGLDPSSKAYQDAAALKATLEKDIDGSNQ